MYLNHKKPSNIMQQLSDDTNRDSGYVGVSSSPTEESKKSLGTLRERLFGLSKFDVHREVELGVDVALAQEQYKVPTFAEKLRSSIGQSRPEARVTSTCCRSIHFEELDPNSTGLEITKLSDAVKGRLALISIFNCPPLGLNRQQHSVVHPFT
jgi:hypothetical protein